MESLAFWYLVLCLISFVIGVAVLRWSFRINKIVSELENIRKVLTVDPVPKKKTTVESTKELLSEAKNQSRFLEKLENFIKEK